MPRRFRQKGVCSLSRDKWLTRFFWESWWTLYRFSLPSLPFIILPFSKNRKYILQQRRLNCRSTLLKQVDTSGKNSFADNALKEKMKELLLVLMQQRLCSTGKPTTVTTKGAQSEEYIPGISGVGNKWSTSKLMNRKVRIGCVMTLLRLLVSYCSLYLVAFNSWRVSWARINSFGQTNVYHHTLSVLSSV